MEIDGQKVFNGEYWFYFPSRLALNIFNKDFSDNEECIICDKKDRFLSRKEDLNFA